MKIYLDACCLNRPFDDQSQYRIRLESEAILIILERMRAHEWEWIGSEALDIEIEKTPDAERRRRLIYLAASAHESVKIQEKEVNRANQIKKIGFKAFDATHIACSESGGADFFLTTDDRLLKRAHKNKEKLNVRIDNPLAWLTEVI